MNILLICIAVSLILSTVSGPFLIPLLKRLKFGQSIREEGPKWHQKKSGTPTMGGIMFVISSLLVTVFSLVYNKSLDKGFLVILIASLLYALIGFSDDYIKVVMKRNLGLTAKQKFLAQLVVSVLSTVILYYFGILNGEIIVPFVERMLNIGLFIIPLIIFMQLSLVNAVNLTDGLDGLAATVTLIVGIFLTVVAYRRNDIDTAIFVGTVSGATLGFLFFNCYPAKVFMGDTGSLFLGGVVAMAATKLNLPIVILIVGFVYLMEALSVVIQVTSFKLTGKRVFKMSPIHHHFEMCGYNEVQIVTGFSLVTLLLCIVAYLGIFKLL